MNYIVNSKYGCDIYQEKTKYTHKASSISYIKLLCISYLFTLEGYLTACRKVFDYKYKIPVYIADHLQFIPTKSIKQMDVIWINYAEIKRFIVENDMILMIFHDESQIHIKMTEKAWLKQIRRLDMIKSYKVKHFHS
ncbi:hypothetical protein BK010_08580 [Tenericutes bacterium MO-XQ]|nr:hypothetical protein BK010_08070 [Tenericutes bacterium MO-XQ]AUD63643.1 hypothetical protein BK010_08580 [Tenericutes bacterium MO-XQ]